MGVDKVMTDSTGDRSAYEQRAASSRPEGAGGDGGENEAAEPAAAQRDAA
jgi:hypothetical protein